MRYCSLFVLLFAVSGCGGPSGTDIEGTVKFDDGAPLSQGSIILTNEGATFRGVVTPDGKYKVLAVAKGDYSVALTGTTVGAETDVDEMAWDQNTGTYVNAGKEAPKPVALLNEKFSDPSKSGLSISVPKGPFDLTVQGP